MSDASSSSSSICAVVTGHTRGFGAALAETLLARGISVLGLSRNRHATLASRGDAAFEQVELDLSSIEEIAQWLGGGQLPRFIGNSERVLLFNNAGTVQPIGPLEVQDPSAVAQSVVLNVAAPLMLSAALAAASTGAADRRIAHISSGAARNAYAGWSVYCATKAALDHHARSVALDSNRALRICSIAPGTLDTDMQAELRDSTDERFPMRGRFVEYKRTGKLATPHDAAVKMIDFVLSDAFGTTPTADLRELP
ncbi:SDR family oxidoreductase [Paraburkholderia sp. SOS3]|jgi:benzil reductase ((S)-benzoin forming)|uniref:SDR family oxidoreductase n=1 Tax=Paraburkholderia sp. SOS3 TaxID=1926494 RepID=UPI0009474EFD|nr:SDR family oxidoreductase [Paraburkholderia sp. SOS3]APR38052.1 short-chain dehydrogenase [Paraburkholderia sp. SOS3]